MRAASWSNCSTSGPPLACVASYLYIAVLWLNHKAALQRIKVMTRGLHWANLGVLFSTALLPWPSALASEAIAEGNPRTTGSPSGSTRSSARCYGSAG
ncbi:TMEM175 family protein [Streptomyces mirabilis]